MNKTKLSEIANIVMGQSPSSEFCGEHVDGMPLLNGPAEFTEFYPIPVQYTSDPKKKSNKGDILFCVRGSTTGRMNWSNQQYAIGRGLAAISHKQGSEYNHLLRYLLENCITSILKNANGSTFPNLTGDLLSNFIISTPEQKYQKKISDFLRNIDQKIETNKRINNELEKMAKALYDYWFVQFDFPDENDKPYKSSGGEMVWNEELEREIPEGWSKGCFGDYAKLKGGFAFKSSWWSENGIPVIKIKDIREDYTLSISNCSLVEQDKYSIAKNYEAKAGDVVIALTGATVGKYGIVTKTDMPILVNQRVGLFKLEENPIKKLPFLINSLNQNYFRKSVFTLASGAAQPNISTDQIDKILLVIPTKDILDKYNEMCANFYEVILKNQSESQKLIELRDWLLPMLMNGQVKVLD